MAVSEFHTYFSRGTLTQQLHQLMLLVLCIVVNHVHCLVIEIMREITVENAAIVPVL